MRYRNFLWALCFQAALFFLPLSVQAQITAGGAVWSGETRYAQSANDRVFAFQAAAAISLTYSPTAGQAPFNFTWYRYNPADNSWNTQVLSSTGNSSTLSVQSPGGYRVVAADSNGDPAGDERCWVYRPALLNPEVELLYDDCFGVELQGRCDSVPLLFYDPATGAGGALNYNRDFTWTAIPALPQNASGERVSLPAPFENTDYTVSIADRYGNAVEATLNYTAIAVEASFEAGVEKPDVLNERHTEVEGSAPVEIRFTDTSKGSITGWEWTFGSSGRAAEPDPFFVFSAAGRDTVLLRVVNRVSECEDVSDPLVVTIMESELDVPNVFTPNGDGVNDEFRVAYRSLKKFNMVIYNRWGREVYQSGDPSQGWDGTIGNTMAAPGVYFYYIEAEGYNPDEKHKRKGPVHLLRGKN